MTSATVGLAAVALVAVGLLAGILLAPGRAPSSVAAPEGERRVAVSSRLFDDARRVEVTPHVAEAVTLTVAESGRVTRTACTPGAVIASGMSPLTVDDRPVLALATTVPLWRDLEWGARGEDVRAMQAELARLGHPVTPTGTYDRPTSTAVATILREIGVAQPSGRLPVASVIWLPAPQVTVASCEVALAQTIGPGPFATVAGGLTSLEVTGGLTGAVAGDRVLRIGDVSAPIDAGGMVTDPAFLAAVAASPEFAFATASNSALTLDAVLATPLEVVVVPPGAIFGIADGTGCVLADGQPRPVRVVASSLGQTMVTFDAGPAPTYVELPLPGEVPPPCR
ncbi:MAG: peptidoglycan-binding protein [Micromonosporaceae bacterium]|nr:peptidoglycan-binding protein [Micromonosporaceae bacterium]